MYMNVNKGDYDEEATAFDNPRVECFLSLGSERLHLG